MSITFTNDSKRLILSGVININDGEALLEAIHHLLGQASPLSVDLGAVEDLDICSLQLLYAARKQAEREGKELRWDQVSSACYRLASLAGMTTALGFRENRSP